MIIAFPIVKNQGLDSGVHSHFGSAPHFVFLDLDADTFEVFENPDQDHQHGDCNPMTALGEQKVDGIVVGGIGGGALKKLKDSGITVYRAVEGSVAENARLIKPGNLPEFEPSEVCGQHHGVQIGNCAH